MIRREYIMTTLLAMLILAPVLGAKAERKELRRIKAAVSYVSSGTFYFDAGRSQGLAAGDTVTVTHASRPQAVGVIVAVSSSSSSARIEGSSSAVAIGDSVLVVKEVVIEVQPPPVVGGGQAPSSPRLALRRESNEVSGRIALQYASAGEFGTPLEFSQPALVTRLEIARLFGTGTTFTLYGRTYYDASALYERYGQGSRAKMRMYELSLVSDNARSPYGFSIGRITSRFVGGLGAFDGGQVFIRKGNLSVGVLGGAQADYSTSSVNIDQTKFAGFMNYAWGGDVFKTSDVTIAYGQQRYLGKIDRTFGYLQSSLRFGSELFFYSSAEIDFVKVENGVRNHTPSLTNTFVTITYMPTSWFSLNTGYDATRTIYLIESMKSISDTLLDKTLKEGFRTSISFRLPMNVTLMGNANFRIASGSTSSAQTLGSTVRVSDILGTDVNFGAQYASIRGLYTEGDDWTLDIDRWMAQSLSMSIRLDRYDYAVRGQEGKLRMTTASASINYRISRSLYSVINFDQVWDVSRNMQRLYLEVGVHF